MRTKRTVNLNVLHGEPTDGSGRVCIHLFVQDEAGKFVEPHAVHPVFEGDVQVKQKVDCKPARGRLACDPKRVPMSGMRNNVAFVTPRTDDPRAVTCPKCIASDDYIKMMTRYNAL